MRVTQIREKLQLVVQQADERFLKMIYAMAKEYKSEEFDLSTCHKKILDERLEAHSKYPHKGSTWKEVKNRIEKQL